MDAPIARSKKALNCEEHALSLEAFQLMLFK